MRRHLALVTLVVCSSPLSVLAADSLTVGELVVDRPTLHSIGLQLMVGDDDDRDATVTVRHRPEGQTEWRDGYPLMRVWPETVTVTVPSQFAGSLFDLEPGTSYEVELTASDPDGGDEVVTATVATRSPPRFEPQTPVVVDVSNVSELEAALSAAQPGHVITLTDGTYAGSFFSISESGTEDDPIVIRGASQDGVVLDGEGCTGCNVVEVYGSHVHVERMTLQGATRALRFQGQGTTGGVARQLKIRDVVHGIGSNAGQTDFFVCDNHVEGRLVWPWPFDSDASTHWDDRGIEVTGDGHVVCHNRIVGFGDPVVNKKSQHRAWDVYGNDVYDAYDGSELDDGEGNTRLFANRYTNVLNPVSIQPVWGGPTYVLRNVVLNAPEEPIKLKSTGGVNEPSGALIFHNTFVSPNRALNLQTPITQHNFRIENNLFVGPETPLGRTVEWTAKLDGGIFDHNGYYPDGGFWLGQVDGQNRVYDDFASLAASGDAEAQGLLLSTPIFEAGFVGPGDEMAHQMAADFSLASGSEALDAGRLLPGFNVRHLGAGPDLGAIEAGCPAPHYGPRPEGRELVTTRIDCSDDDPGTGGAGGGGTGAGGGGLGGSNSSGGGGATSGSGGAGAAAEEGGCGCSVVAPRWGAGLWVLGLGLAAGLVRRRWTVHGR